MLENCENKQDVFNSTTLLWPLKSMENIKNIRDFLLYVFIYEIGKFKQNRYFKKTVFIYVGICRKSIANSFLSYLGCLH